MALKEVVVEETGEKTIDDHLMKLKFLEMSVVIDFFTRKQEHQLKLDEGALRETLKEEGMILYVLFSFLVNF